MTLLELCDPLFQHICRFNRSVRKGGHYDLAALRSEVKAMLADMANAANIHPELTVHFHVKDKDGQEYGIDLVMMFFVDFMVKSSALPGADQWKELAHERKELAGDEKFFDLLEETLADRSEAATQRLMVYYTCMGLGFTGVYTGQPQYLRTKMRECKDRLRNLVDFDQTTRVCPDAYENVDTANLVQAPGSSLVGIGIALLGMIVVLVIVNVWLYRASSRDLANALQTIIDHDPHDPNKTAGR